MSGVILCNLSDIRQLINEERQYWLFDLLDALGVPDEVYDAGSIDEYRESMDELGIEIILKTSGDVDVYKKQWYEEDNEENCGWLPVTKDHLVGQWKEPKRIRKVDGKEVYYEVHLNEWSILRMR